MKHLGSIFLYPPATFCLLDPDILLNTSFSDTLKSYTNIKR
jgi:hypothetical protein